VPNNSGEASAVALGLHENSMNPPLPLDARHAGHLRTLNLERILSVAMERPAALTRQELGQVTSLSAPTISILASDLLRRGLLRDAGAAASRGGRRATLVEFNARYGVVLGIDVGSSDTRFAVADLRGEVLARRAMPTPNREPADLLAGVAVAARALLREPAVASSSLMAVAAAAPGAVDRARGVVVALVPNLKGWRRVPMAEILARALGAPVVVDNDVNLAVVGERWRGVARGHDTCAFLSVGAGIGAGIVIGGELHRGHHSLAGEIGLMCPGAEYAEHEFGARGGLESMAGMKALGDLWAGPPAPRGDGWVEGLFAAARLGEARAQEVVRQVGTLLGMATTNLALVLDPSLIVFGGPLLTKGSPLLDETRRIVARIIPSPPEMLASELGHDATLWGCLLTAANEARVRLRDGLRSRPA
jgi:predicted NBD/HSP70 family sugar kinase